MISVHHFSLPHTFPTLRSIKSLNLVTRKRMDHSLESIYYDLLEREMSERQPMSLWGPGQTLYKPTSTSAQVRIRQQCTNSYEW